MEEAGSGACAGRHRRPGRAAADWRRPRAARAPRRLPHPARGRPRRHGRRLRGRAGVAGPARRAEGAAAARGPRRAAAWSASAARRGPRPGCTTPTSCRSSASARTTAMPLLRHAVHPGPGRSTRCSTSCARLRAGQPRPDRGAGRRQRRPLAADRRFARADAAGARAGPATRAAPSADARRLAAGRVQPGRDDAARPGPRLLPQRGPRRRAGGRRPGLRPRPGRRSTATSSRPTCCSTPRATSGSPTSAWPRPTTATT